MNTKIGVKKSYCKLECIYIFPSVTHIVSNVLFVYTAVECENILPLMHQSQCVLCFLCRLHYLRNEKIISTSRLLHSLGSY